MKRTPPGISPRQTICEVLETRVVLDASLPANCFAVDYSDSDFVTEHENGTLQFASLRVGERMSLGNAHEVLDDSQRVEIEGHDLTIAQVKEFLHGMADSIGTDQIIETLDLRFSDWGHGSGSTTQRFTQYIAAQLGEQQACGVLRFDGDVRFELPRIPGELFSGGSLDLPANDLGTLINGDIAEIVEGYELIVHEGQTTLAVHTHIRDVSFIVNSDGTLTDSYGATWAPTSGYQILDPQIVDEVMGDIDGNGRVDFEDFLILAQNYGTQTSVGDLDLDGSVGFGDFLLLSANFGG